VFLCSSSPVGRSVESQPLHGQIGELLLLPYA